MKILVLCTYPISNPRHGGQLRVSNIVETYQRAGFNVQVIGVLGSEQYESEEGFLQYPGMNQLAAVIQNPSLMEDYAIGRLFCDDTRFFDRLASVIKIKPDVIHIEQPWLFAFAQRYVSLRVPDAKLVYGSQNTEWRLKQEILASCFDADKARENAELIKKVELNAISGADAITCVSESDAEWLKSQTSTPVLLAPNGVRAWQSSGTSRKEALAITQGCRYALYCASAHPPNMTGFFNMFGGGFGSLKPDERLVVAGGAGRCIAGDVRLQQSPKLEERLVVGGIVSQPCLEGLLDEASCIVLPLTQGGGTNLKTAEALWAGKHIVATSVAMRGFERFIGTSGVNLVDDSSAFKRALRAAMSAGPLKLSIKEIEARRSVLWESCLSPLIVMIKNLKKES